MIQRRMHRARNVAVARAGVRADSVIGARVGAIVRHGI